MSNDTNLRARVTRGTCTPRREGTLELGLRDRRALLRPVRALAACVVIAALAAAAPRADPAGAQASERPVARLEVAAPARSPFLLRATLPVPKGVFPRADGRSPFVVASHGRGHAQVPAQVEIVSRYPTGEADVVEILARVELAEGVRENDRVGYSVFLAPCDAAAEPALEPAVVDLLAREPRGRIGLRTRDVHGNTYWADLAGNAQDPGFGSLRVLKSGRWERQRRVYATLVPSGTPDAPSAPSAPDAPNAEGAPLAHSLGVHAYLRERAGERGVPLELRVNNGAVAGSREPHPLETTLGIVYFRDLELVVPKGWTAVPEVRDPFFGEPYAEGDTRVIPLVRALDEGKLHVIGPQAQLVRRLVLVPLGAEAAAEDELAQQGLAFCARGPGLWSWFEPETARYFAQRDLLASVDFYKHGGLAGKAAVRMKEAGELRAFREALATGAARGYYVTSPVMGWAHPWFVKEAGGVGGEGIATFEGHWAAGGASREGWQKLALLHRMNVSRQPEAAYDRFGDPVGYHAWLDAQGRIPFDFRLNGGVIMPPFLLPARRGPPASAQVLAVVERGLRPPYDHGTPHLADGEVPDRADNLLAWRPHDDQHMIRYTKNAKALVWLGNDALAKDDLLLSAELFHLMFHESEHVPASWSPGVTLRVWEGIVAAHPHQGAWIGREHAWGIDSMCAAYSVAGPEWRARHRPWFDRLADFLVRAEQPSGLLQRFVNVRLLGHDKYAVAQAFECFFLIHAIRCVGESVLRGVDDARRAALEEIAVRGTDYLMWGPPWARMANGWQPDPARPTLFVQGPRQGIAISPNDDFASPPFSDAGRWGPDYLPPDGLGQGVEIFHPWAALSYVEEITRERAGAGLANKYLKRALDCAEPRASWREFLDGLHRQAADASLDNSPNWIGLVGKLQSLGER